MKNIVILGSTGSIGKQTLDVLRRKKGYFKVLGLAAKDEVFELKKQIKEFKPEIVSVADKETEKKLLRLISKPKPKIYFGDNGLLKLATDPKANSIVVSASGTVALTPTLKAIQAKREF